MSENRFLTIRQCAAAGPLSEHTLRLRQKQGRLPGIYSGTRFLVNYKMFLERLDRESTGKDG